MDLFDLLIIAALALPAIFRWLNERSRTAAPGQQPGPPADTDGPTRETGESEFDRALREITEVLGGSTDTADEPAPQVEEHFEPFPSTEPAATRASSGFSREEAFEKKASETSMRAAAVPFKRLKLRRIEVPVLEQAASEPPKARSETAAFLQEKSSARQAVIASEIIGRPLALRDRSSDEAW